MVYLIHFNRPLKHARHYVGYAKDRRTFDQRITDHLCGVGARLLAVLLEAGIEWRVVRTWPDGDRAFERRLKSWSGSAQFCPVCAGEKALRRAKTEN